MSLLSSAQRSGFAHTSDLIHFFVGGSQLHGAKVAQTDDLDIYGVFVEPPEQCIGLNRLEHFVWSTAGDDRRNGPDDVDVTFYSLRKWASLAAKGNATTLHFFFAPPDPEILSPIWSEVVAHRAMFLSKRSGAQFRGFAESQMRRLKGEGVGKHGIREEYVGKFGYDTKAAMHLLRLLFEGIELLTTGWITLPRPEKEFLISIRTGEFGSLEKVLNFANQKFLELDEAERKSPLPDSVEMEKVSALVTRLYLEHLGAHWVIACTRGGCRPLKGTRSQAGSFPASYLAGYSVPSVSRTAISGIKAVESRGCRPFVRAVGGRDGVK